MNVGDKNPVVATSTSNLRQHNVFASSKHIEYQWPEFFITIKLKLLLVTDDGSAFLFGLSAIFFVLFIEQLTQAQFFHALCLLYILQNFKSPCGLAAFLDLSVVRRVWGLILTSDFNKHCTTLFNSPKLEVPCLKMLKSAFLSFGQLNLKLK